MLTNSSSRPEELRAAAKIFGFVRPYKWEFSSSLLLYSGQNFFISLVISLLLSWLSEAMLSGDVNAVYRSGIIYVALIALLMILIAWGVQHYTFCGEKIRRDLKTKLFRSFIRTGSEQSSGLSGKGIAALNIEASQASQIFGASLFTFLYCFLSITFSAVVIFWVDWRLGAISLSVGLVALLLQYRFAEPLGNLNKERLGLSAETVKKISNLISGGASIRAFGLQQQVLQDFDGDNQQLLQLSFREATIMTWQDVFSTVQGWLTMAGVFGIGGYLVAGGHLTISALMMVPTLSMAISQGMSQIGRAWAGLQAPVAACVRLAEMLDQDERLQAMTAAVAKQTTAWDGDYTLSLNDLSFAYLSAERNALEQISLTVEPNQMIAFVGRSGCGKSTLLRAIIGMYERPDLSMQLGSLSYATTPLSDWRRKFAYVDQSCTLFNMTIAENIALGRPGCEREEIIRAAREAGAAEFINSLPLGYDTPCGEKGAALSGSQKQRIVIARALVRQAPILVFDEATASLDTEAEYQVMQTIAALRRKHTILVVTHHLQQISDADKIVVLCDGRIEQSGRHEELLRQGGEYVRLLQQESTEEMIA